MSFSKNQRTYKESIFHSKTSTGHEIKEEYQRDSYN